MNRLLILIIAITSLTGMNLHADSYFPYPAVPESLPVGRARANYIVEHFWDHCPWKSAFSSHKKMENALREYAEIFPLAAADTVFASIDNLIDKVSKRPKDLVELTRMAEALFYADSAYFPNEEIYARFATAASKHKKTPAADRERLKRQIQVINHSKEGAALPAIPMTLADGSTIMLNDTTDAYSGEYILIFDIPDSPDGRMERLFLQANASASALIESEWIKPIFIYPGTPDQSWWKALENVPQKWIVAALPQAFDYFDLRHLPNVYIVDSNKVIPRTNLTIPFMIQTCEEIMNQIRREQ